MSTLRDAMSHAALGWVKPELDETLRAAGIKLCVAEMKDPVKDKLKRFGLFARIGESAFFATIGAAVSSYLARYPELRATEEHDDFD